MPASSASATTARRSGRPRSCATRWPTRAARAADRRPPRGPRPRPSGAEANEGFVATVLGLRGWPAPAEAAAVARDLAILAEVVRDVPGARLHLTHVSTAAALDLVRRAKAAGLPVTCDVTPASPGPHRRVARRRPALGLGGAATRTAIRGATARSWPRRTRRRSGSTRRCARRPMRWPAWPRCATAPPTPSPPTTRRTPRSTRRSSSGSRPTASAASRRRSGWCSRRSTPAELPLARAIAALTTGPAAVLGALARRGRGARARRGRAGGPRRLRSLGAWTVTAAGLASRGKNSPLLGIGPVRPRPVTLAGGRIAYEAADTD